jgi:glycosyltransferase involved in cell wall biosynthesis
MVADLWAEEIEAAKNGSDPGALEWLARHGEPADRLFAEIACARWYMARGRQSEAAVHAARAARNDQIIIGFLDPSLPLTAGVILREAGQEALGTALLKRAGRRFPHDPDLGIALAPPVHPLHPLHLAYLRRGLGLAAPGPGQGPAFDRLTCRTTGQVNGPLVTVLIAARNAEKTLSTALRSLAAPSWHNLEIVVIDNGSTDDTTQIAERWALVDSRVRLLDGAAANGAYGARNIGLAAATGDFVTGLDADDWAHPERIARQIAPFARNPRLKATISDWYRADDQLRPRLFWRQDRIIHPNISSLLFRRSLGDDIGYWDEAPAGADSEFRDRIIARFGVNVIECVLPGLPLSIGRSRVGSLTTSKATTIASQRAGPRADYARAAAAWHKSGPLFLERAPKSRAFPLVPATGARPKPFAAQATPLACARRKIIVFAHAAGPEIYGAEHSLLDVLSAARAAGVDAEIVLPVAAAALYVAALTPLVSRVHVHPQRLRRGGAPPTEDEVNALIRIIEGTGADEVHVNTCTLDAPLIAARALGRTPVLHLRELPQADPQLCRDLALTPVMLRTAILGQADRIIANSRTTLDWIGTQNAILAPNRVDPALFDLPIRTRGRVRIGLLGSGTPRKGLLDFVRIAQALRSEKSLDFVLVGPMPQSHLPKAIRAAGYVQTPVKAISQCDLVLSLSHFAESFGRTVAEAMAAGRPVIAYDHGHPSALLGNGGGILVPRGDWRSVARQIKRVAGNAALYERLAVEGRAAARPLAEPWPPALAEQVFGLGNSG